MTTTPVDPHQSLVTLAAAADGPLEAVGGKARTLGLLLRAGFPVPDGVVLRPPSAPGSDLDAALEDVVERLGPGPLAVRSSAAAEDGRTSSFAGQLHTELGVEGTEALRDAVRRCREAARAEHVAAYQAARDDDGDARGLGSLPLLLQRMVPADAAGVAFTVDPRSGARDAVVVEAVAGLGEKLVSGRATPERWRVTPDEAVREPPAEHPSDRPERASPVLDEADARAVARLARRVEEALDGPQDVEWALAGGELYLLQARPVTAGGEELIEPVPVSAEPPASGFWFRDTAHFPRPFHPLFASIYIPRYREAVARGFREFGVLVDGVEIREIGGWPYSRIRPPGGKEGPAPPSWLLWLLSRLAPSLRGKMRRAREARDEDRAAEHVARWWDEWRPELESWVRRADALELSGLSRKELRGHYRSCVDTFERGLHIHFRLFPPFFLAVTDLVFFCRDELGWEKGRAMELLAGVSRTSSEPGRALEELARTVAESPEARAALEEGDPTAEERLRRSAPRAWEAFQSYQERYGLRTVHYDFGTPTFRERPEMVLGLLADQLRGGGGGTGQDEVVGELRKARLDEARDLLRERPEALRRFERLLERARHAYPVREDNEFVALSVLGLLRFAALEAGRRMVEAGHLEEADQVFFLTDAELTEWLDTPRDLRETARERQGRRRWALAHPGPDSYGEDPGPPPDPSPLPEAGRRVTRALLWTVENDLDAPTGAPGDASGDVVRGVGASPGSYTGPVRVVHSEEEFGKVRAGDVLVCPITSSTWSVLFPNLGALVTDAGGLLSHPAIIAREFGIPAVLATGCATDELEDGDRVRVDGSTGLVEPCRAPPG